MVRAILDGRKTQTRRVVPFQPTSFGDPKWWEPDFVFQARPPTQEAYIAEAIKRCRYGGSGTRLYVKETHFRYGYWRKDGLTKTGKQRWRFVAVHATRIPSQYKSVYYLATGAPPALILTRKSVKRGWYKRPAIFLPYGLVRLFLEITNVRAERLNEISEAGAKAEGVSEWIHDPVCPCGGLGDNESAAEFIFRHVWDALNAKRGYSWESNPFVLVIQFKKL